MSINTTNLIQTANGQALLWSCSQINQAMLRDKLKISVKLIFPYETISSKSYTEIEDWNEVTLEDIKKELWFAPVDICQMQSYSTIEHGDLRNFTISANFDIKEDLSNCRAVILFAETVIVDGRTPEDLVRDPRPAEEILRVDYQYEVKFSTFAYVQLLNSNGELLSDGIRIGASKYGRSRHRFHFNYIVENNPDLTDNITVDSSLYPYCGNYLTKEAFEDGLVRYEAAVTDYNAAYEKFVKGRLAVYSDECEAIKYMSAGHEAPIVNGLLCHRLGESETFKGKNLTNPFEDDLVHPTDYYASPANLVLEEYQNVKFENVDGTVEDKVVKVVVHFSMPRFISLDFSPSSVEYPKTFYRYVDVYVKVDELQIAHHAIELPETSHFPPQVPTLGMVSESSVNYAFRISTVDASSRRLQFKDYLAFYTNDVQVRFTDRVELLPDTYPTQTCMSFCTRHEDWNEHNIYELRFFVIPKGFVTSGEYFDVPKLSFTRNVSQQLQVFSENSHYTKMAVTDAVCRESVSGRVVVSWSRVYPDEPPMDAPHSILFRNRTCGRLGVSKDSQGRRALFLKIAGIGVDVVEHEIDIGSIPHFVDGLRLLFVRLLDYALVSGQYHGAPVVYKIQAAYGDYGATGSDNAYKCVTHSTLAYWASDGSQPLRTYKAFENLDGTVTIC